MLTAELAKPLKLGVVPTHPARDTAVALRRLRKAGNSRHPPIPFIHGPNQGHLVLLFSCLHLANVRRAKNTAK